MTTAKRLPSPAMEDALLRSSVPDLPSLIRDYADHIASTQQLSEHTVRNYINDLVPLVEFLDESTVTNLKNVDRLLLRGYLASLISAEYSRSSVSRKLSALKSFFRFLRQNSDLELDQIDLVTGPKKEKKLPAIASNHEIDRLLDEPNTSTNAGIRDRAILEMLYGAGLRVSEANAMDIADVDLKTKEARIIGKGLCFRHPVSRQDSIRMQKKQPAGALSNGSLSTSRELLAPSPGSFQKLCTLL